jgi:hypothetical protein
MSSARTSFTHPRPKMSFVAVLGRIRSWFSSFGAGDEAAEREEYAIPDRGEAELDRDLSGSFAEREGAELALDELDELRPPPDPAP